MLVQLPVDSKLNGALVNLLFIAVPNITQSGFNHMGNLLAHVPIIGKALVRMTQKVSATSKQFMLISLLYLLDGRSLPLLMAVGWLPNTLMLQTFLFITEVVQGPCSLITKVLNFSRDQLGSQAHL